MSANEFDNPGSAAATADWLDRVLADDARDAADSHLADDGFTARVMSALPAPAAVPAWRKPAVAALWSVAAVCLAIALPGVAVDVAREAFKLFSAKPFSLYEIAAVLGVAGVATWSLVYYLAIESFAFGRSKVSL